MTTTTLTRIDPAEPSGIDATLLTLGCPVFGFAAQPHLSELTATTVSDRARVVGVSLSYTYYRHPVSRNHPSNFIELTPAQNRAVELAESSDLPLWLIEQITRTRYPTLWDAVRTAPATRRTHSNCVSPLTRTTCSAPTIPGTSRYEHHEPPLPAASRKRICFRPPA
jgi:hypothetical protein